MIAAKNITFTLLNAQGWQRVLEAQFAHLNPIITEALSRIEEGGAESAAQYRDIVIPHLATNVVPNLAAGLALTTQAMMTRMIHDAVQVMSEKTVVTKHDDCGRVLEFVKAPLVRGLHSTDAAND